MRYLLLIVLIALVSSCTKEELRCMKQTEGVRYCVYHITVDEFTTVDTVEGYPIWSCNDTLKWGKSNITTTTYAHQNNVTVVEYFDWFQ